MKTLLLAFLVACGLLALRTDGAATETDPAIIALRQSFPEKGSVRDDIYTACQKWFTVLTTTAAVNDAVRHATETQGKYLDELTAAKASGVSAQEKTRLQASITWLRGPFTTYLNQWRKLAELPEETAHAAAPAGPPPPDIKATIAEATRAAAMVKDIEGTDATFLKNHTGLKADLATVGTAAQAVLDAGDHPTQVQADSVLSAVTTAIKQAQTISTRATETAAAKANAKNLMTKLRSL